MARYTGPKLRIVRRLGTLPGLTRKTSKKEHPPGKSPQSNMANKKISEYGIRLQEKQKLRFNYGITEKQLLRYIKEAKRVKEPTGKKLLQLLEMRLDNIVFRLGMAPTIPAARQLVNHAHLSVNNRIVDIPSFQCKPGDIIKVRPRETSQSLIKENLQRPTLTTAPNHLDLDESTLTGKVRSIIDREEIALKVNELLVVEYYAGV